MFAPNKKYSIISSILILTTLGIGQQGHAQAIYNWADWISSDTGSVSGTISDVTLGSVGVTFTGTYAFANLTTNTNFWTPASTYTNAYTSNAPTTTDIIGLGANGTYTLAFSQPVTNPTIAIVSLGPGTTWTFNQAFVVASNGPGFWGSGPLTNPTGNALLGSEGHGSIVFPGTYNFLSWTSTNAEVWAGFTVGAAPAPPVAAPEPTTLSLLLLGASAIGVRLRRKK
jgi:PEP-CTERM motif